MSVIRKRFEKTSFFSVSVFIKVVKCFMWFPRLPVLILVTRGYPGTLCDPNFLRNLFWE